MIVGEEQWIGRYHEEEYDLFFKKVGKNIRKTFKKIKPVQALNPLAVPRVITTKLLAKKKAPSAPKVNVQEVVNNAVQAKEVELANDRQSLMQEIADFEEKKVEEISKINEEQTKVEQAQIENEQGEDKKMLYIGVAAILGFVAIAGLMAYIKSRQQQLNALNVDELQ